MPVRLLAEAWLIVLSLAFTMLSVALIALSVETLTGTANSRSLLELVYGRASQVFYASLALSISLILFALLLLFARRGYPFMKRNV